MTDPAPAPAQQQAAPTSEFRDDDLVYVDPDARKVVGRVQWNRNGNPKSMPYTPVDTASEPSITASSPPDKTPKAEKGERAKGRPKDRGERRRSFRKHYPWGTYRSMRNVYKLEGKKRIDPHKKLDEVMEKALKEPFWD